LSAVFLLALVAYSALAGLSSVKRSNVLVATLARAQRYHQDGDMMHDALRSDVLDAQLVGNVSRGGSADAVQEIRDRVAEDAAQFRTDLDRVQALRVPGAPGALLADVRPSLLAYITHAEALTDLANSDRVAALAQLPSFDEEFIRLEQSQALVTEQLAEATESARAQTDRAESGARRQLLLAAVLATGALVGLVLLFERLGANVTILLRRLEDARRRAHSEKQFLGAALESLQDGVVACDAGGTLTLFNRAAERFHGLSVERIPLEECADQFDLYLPDGVTPMKTEDIPLFRALKGDDVEGVEMVIAPHDGERRLLQANGRAIHDGEGNKLGAVVAMHDITGRKAAEEELVRQAFQDPLTGLPNRTLLADRLAGAHARSRRALSPVWLLCLDIDEFKTINDGLGHAAGDQVLVAVAERLRRCLRPADTVARLGGDEFAVLIEDDEAVLLAGRIATALRTPIRVDAGRVFITASIGLAKAGFGGVDVPTELLQAADVAMYVAKARGKDRYEVFDPEMHAAVQRRHELGAALRLAIGQGELVLQYQPQVELGSGAVSGVEALVRWQHPTQGLIPPDEFIPLAEDTGLIIDIDDWVLRTACAQAQEWRTAQGQPLRLAVNLSGRQFQHPGVVKRITSALSAGGFDAKRLEVEVTETAAVREADVATSALQQLRSMGVTVAIDDFGTGYSVLSRLREFPLDTLKIDRAFVGEIDESSESAPLVSAMIVMAHGLGLGIVAEGVETLEQLRFLRDRGCDQAQGYLLSKPVAPHAIPALLRAPSVLFDVQREAPTAPGPELPELLNVVAGDRSQGLDAVTLPLLTELERLTGLESTYLTQIHWRRDEQEIRVAHNAGGLHVPKGARVEWCDTLCRQVLLGGPRFTTEVPEVYPDSQAAQALGLQTYVSVPVYRDDGEVFGTLCGASRSRRPLDDTAVRVMELFARVIATHLEPSGDRAPS